MFLFWELELPEDWDKHYLSTVKMALRIDPSSATGKPPAELLLGRALVYPIELQGMKLNKKSNVGKLFFFFNQKSTQVPVPFFFCWQLCVAFFTFFFLDLSKFVLKKTTISKMFNFVSKNCSRLNVLQMSQTILFFQPQKLSPFPLSLYLIVTNTIRRKITW